MGCCWIITVLIFQCAVIVHTYRNGNNFTTRFYDYIIVGAGSAGTILAARLSEDCSTNVLLLEAGDDNVATPSIETPRFWPNLMSNPERTWQYRTVPQKFSLLASEDRTEFAGTGKGLGGSSNVYGVIHNRGSKSDFDNWAVPGWSYDDVLKYFLKSEDFRIQELNGTFFHGSGGPWTVSTTDNEESESEKLFVKAARELGIPTIDCNDPNKLGFCKIQFSIKGGEKVTSYNAYLQTALGRPNLTVLTKTHVKNVLISQDKMRARGVMAIQDGKKIKFYANQEVILSAGTYRSPQLLLLSGIGQRNQLKKLKIRQIIDLPVGENLHDHVRFQYDIIVNSSTLTGQNFTNPKEVAKYLFRRKGLLGKPLDVTYLVFENLPSDNFNSPAVAFGLLHGLPENGLFSINENDFGMFPKGKTEDFSTKRDGLSTQITLLHPRSRGTVTINSKDPFRFPLIDPNYFSSTDDTKKLIAGINALQQIVKSQSFAKIRPVLDDANLPTCSNLTVETDDYWACRIAHTADGDRHVVGTCKMGNVHDNSTVTDPRLRVKGIKGLRVVDASIIPSSTAYGTMAQVVMIAEKAADMIKEDRNWYTKSELNTLHLTPG